MKVSSVTKTMWAVVLAMMLAVGGLFVAAPGLARAGEADSVAVATIQTKATTVKVAKATVSSAKSTIPGKAVVKAKKVSGAKGYQYKIALNKGFTKSAVTKTIAKQSYTFTNLKQGTKYYVKVRAYKTVNGKKTWGKWSAVKAVTVKTSPAVGKWEVTSMTSPSSTTSASQLSQAKSMGITMVATFNKNGTGVLQVKNTGTLNIGSVTAKFKWKPTGAKTGKLTSVTSVKSTGLMAVYMPKDVNSLSSDGTTFKVQGKTLKVYGEDSTISCKKI